MHRIFFIKKLKLKTVLITSISILLIWTQHNPRVPLGIIAVISKGCFWQISNVIIKFVCKAFLYHLNSSTVNVILNWYWHTLINVVYRENQIDLASSRFCSWLYRTKRLWVTNREPPELSLYAFKPVWKTTFKTPWRKLPNLLGIKLLTDAILLFLLSVNNVIYLFLFKVAHVDYELNWINGYFY